MKAYNFEDGSDAHNLHIHRLEDLQVYPCSVCHAYKKTDGQFQKCFVIRMNLLKLC